MSEVSLSSPNLPRRWQDIAHELISEQNPDKFAELAHELNEAMLEEERLRVQERMTKNPPNPFSKNQAA